MLNKTDTEKVTIQESQNLEYSIQQKQIIHLELAKLRQIQVMHLVSALPVSGNLFPRF